MTAENELALQRIAYVDLLAENQKLRDFLDAFVKAVDMHEGLSSKDVRWFADEARSLLPHELPVKKR